MRISVFGCLGWKLQSNYGRQFWSVNIIKIEGSNSDDFGLYNGSTVDAAFATMLLSMRPRRRICCRLQFTSGKLGASRDAKIMF